MFTKQIQNLVNQLRGHIPEPAIQAFEDTLGGCDQTLEHRGPIGAYIDGADRVAGGFQRKVLPQVCFSYGEPIAAVTASNPSGFFSSDTCISDCVTGGLALRAIGPSALDSARIETAYVGTLLDLCGNPFPTGSGTEPVRFEITALTATANMALGRVVAWTGAAYAMTGPVVAFVDYTTNTEFSSRWAVGWQGWATAKADRPTVTIAATPYTAYEVMWIECQARFIEFQTTATMAGGPPQFATATVLNSWGADDYANAPSTTTVYDRLNKVPGIAAGFTGLAIWDEQAAAGVGQYIIVASSGAAPGDELFRFQLSADLAWGGSANATLLDQTLTPIGGVVTVADVVGEWRGKNGYQGWCAQKSDNPGIYEIVFMEGQCRWLPFTLTANMSGGSATAIAGTCWGRTDNGKDPTGHPNLTVHDTQLLFQRAVSGAEGIAVWDDKTDQYEVIECDSKAGAISGSHTGAALGDTSLTVTASDFWGTQQDNVAPVATDTSIRSGVYDYWECPSGGTVVAIYDAIDDKYVVVDGEKIAMAIEFTVDTDISSPATVGHFLGGLSPGSTYNISDDSDLGFDRALNNATGIGIWHNQGGGSSYAIVNCQTKAGETAYVTQANYTGGQVPASISSFWGTQQDIQNPDTTIDILDIHGFWQNLCRSGAKGYSIYDNVADNYKAVWQETFAHHIRYVSTSTVSAADADFDALVTEFHSGQNPTTTMVKVRNVNQRAGNPISGSAYLDTVSSTPTAPVYIDIEAKPASTTSRVRWGRCTTNWYKGGGNCDSIGVQESTICDWTSTSHSVPFDVSDGNYRNDFDVTGTPTAGYTVLLPKVQGCDPNIVSGDVIGFMQASDGTYCCVSDYTDDAIGCAKLFTLGGIALPGGWAVMNGGDNAAGLSGGSGIDTSDLLIRGIDGAPNGTPVGRDRVPEDDLSHHHLLNTTSFTQVLEGGLGDPEVIDNGSCMEGTANAFDDYVRDASDIADNMSAAPRCGADRFGPLNIENPHIHVPYIERVDNSQDNINTFTP